MTYQQLASQDAQFLYIQSPNALTHVTSVVVYDPSTAPNGVVRFKDIIAHVESRLNASPIFKRKLLRLPIDFDHPYWVEDEHFDLESHITHSRLPKPADWRQFCIHLARHHSKPMDMSRPLWDMYVVEGLGGVAGFPKGSYALITRLHHAAIDGVSAAHLLAALSDIDAEGTPAISIPKTPPDYSSKPSGTAIMRRAWFSNLTSPLKMANTMFRMGPDIAKSVQKNLKSRRNKDHYKTSVPDTRFNGPLSPHRVFDAAEFKLEDIIGLRKLVEGATVNDVILAIVAGGLRLYLTKHNELPEETLIATAPINARTSKDDEKNPGNKISAMQVEIGTQIEDPVERLTHIQTTTKSLKKEMGGVGTRVVNDLSEHAPGITMSAAARLMTMPRFALKVNNLFVSNVAGPNFPLYMNGAKGIRQYGMAPLSSGMGLFIATPSYNGIVTFNIISDRKILPDIDFLKDCMTKSFESFMATKPSTKKSTVKSKATRKKK